MATSQLPPRPAVEADLDGLLALGAEAFSAEEVPELQRTIGVHGIGAFEVIDDPGDGIVACSALLSRTLTVDGLAVPTGQIEFVATAAAHRRRGYIRALITGLHRRSAAAGNLVEFIIGIPYFYRRFGYGRAPWGAPRWGLTGEADLSTPAGWRTRPATPADAALLAAVDDTERRASGLATCGVLSARTPGLWPGILADQAGERILLSEGPAGPGAYARTWEADGRLWAFEAAAVDRTAAAALLTGLAELAASPLALAVTAVPGTPLDSLLLDVATPLDAGEPPYARIADPVALLTHLGPVLEARLDGTPFAAGRQHLELNTYRSAVRIDVHDGRLRTVRAVRPHEACPAGATSLPPERLPELLLGAHDIVALERLDPDVRCRGTRALTRTLLPARRAHVTPQ